MDRNHGDMEMMETSETRRRHNSYETPSAFTPNEPWEHLIDGEDEQYDQERGHGTHSPTKTAAVEIGTAESSQAFESQRRLRLADRLGKRAMAILALSPLVMLGTLGFIAFLWFGDRDNATWHRFMARSWVTRAVSVSALVLRFAIGLHGAVGVAMLATLALEHYGIPLEKAPAVAVMRSGETSPQTIFIHTVMGWGRPVNLHWLYSILAIVLFTAATLLQLTSTALLSDLKLGVLPGFPAPSPLYYDFAYNMTALADKQNFIPAIRRETPWARNPQFYPTFGEYSSPVPPRSDVDDTGVLLRAFLPMTDSQQRQTLRNYTGKALVLDSRVACQQPILTNLSLSWDPTSGSICAITGFYENSTSSPGLLTPNTPVSFACPSYFYSNGYTVCQLENIGIGENVTGNPAGALQSAFTDSADESPMRIFGAPYLVFNSTIDVTTVTEDGDPPLGLVEAEAPEGSGVWTHWHIPKNETESSTSEEFVADFNFTLCYTAFDAARLYVNLYSFVNRTEPLPQFQPSAQSYTFDGVLVQLGNNASNIGARDRGILQMEELDSWIPSSDDTLPNGVQPWLQGTTDMQSVSLVPGHLIDHYTSGNQSSVLDTANLWYTTPGMTNADPSLVSLFTETMANNQSIAGAMSSLITVLSSMAYYDQSAQFQVPDEVEQVYFTLYLYPHSHRGFVAVVITICVQLIVVAVIASMFLRLTQFTMIGNAWQSVAQVVSPLTQELLKENTLSKDSNVALQLKQEGMLRDRVKVAPLQDGLVERCGLVRSGLIRRVIKGMREAANHVSIPLGKYDGIFFNPALLHTAVENKTKDLDRTANLLQKSTTEGMSREVQAFVAALADDFPFPTNMDKRPPAPGETAPESEQDVVCVGLGQHWGSKVIVRELGRLKTESRPETLGLLSLEKL